MDKARILIVEDDLDLSEMVSSYFRVQNYDVTTAAWGEEALKITDQHLFDLIMLDIRLPDIDGFELCRRLRGRRRTSDTPILFLTEKRDRVDKLQGLELGVIDYITKPFDIQELRLRVRNALNRAASPSAVNPVTDLPEGEYVSEKIAALIKRDTPWALLQFTIEKLGDFRARYGFVAADDVMRAVTLMVRNAVREYGDDSDFIGHFMPDSFVIITAPSNVESIQERVQRRVVQSHEYFYPLKDRAQAQRALQEQHLRLLSGTVDHTQSYDSLDKVKKALSGSMSAEV